MEKNQNNALVLECSECGMSMYPSESFKGLVIEALYANSKQYISKPCLNCGIKCLHKIHREGDYKQ